MVRTEIGRWRLGEVLGEGGMGTVYLAHHQTLEIPAAAKLLSSRLSREPKFRERFLREARAQAQLRHPGIAQVLDFIEDGEDLCIVVEYLPGGNLEKQLEPGKPLPVEAAITWARQALEALDHAHQRGIIHRDIKPSNIMLDEKRRAKVVDFGIALVLDGGRRLTTATGSMGTPHYMSPEQIRRPHDVDHRTDVYSMGVVLYEMLAGRPPFDADSDFDIHAAQVSEPPKPLRELNPKIPKIVEAVVLQALEKNPDKRFSGCGAFARALEAPQPEKKKLPPPPPPQPTSKLKWLAATLGAVAVISLGMALWMAFELYKENRARRAEKMRAEALHELAGAKSWNLKAYNDFSYSKNSFVNESTFDIAGGIQSLRWLNDGRYKWRANAQESQAFSAVLWSDFSQETSDVIYVSVEIQSEVSSSDGYGALVFGSTGDSFYSYRISGGRYSLWRHQGTSSVPIESWSYSWAISPGDLNRISVIILGEMLTLYINDQLVSETTTLDLEEVSGQVGLAVGFEKKEGAATFEFDDFEIRM